MNKPNKKIIKEEQIELYDEIYTEITYEDGKKILRTFDEELKMWVTLKFKDKNTPEEIQDMIDYVIRNL